MSSVTYKGFSLFACNQWSGISLFLGNPFHSQDLTLPIEYVRQILPVLRSERREHTWEALRVERSQRGWLTLRFEWQASPYGLAFTLHLTPRQANAFRRALTAYLDTVIANPVVAVGDDQEAWWWDFSRDIPDDTITLTDRVIDLATDLAPEPKPEWKEGF